MLKKLFHKIKGDRKYFAIVFFIIVLILLTGIIVPELVNYKKNNWPTELSNKITSIQTNITSIFKKHESKLLDKSKQLKNELSKTLNPRNSSYGALIKLVNAKDFQKYSIEVLAPNGKLIAWNSKVAIPQNEILPLAYPAGQTHFYNSDLVSYLTVTDTVIIENDQFYYVISLPIEKHYKLENSYFKQINLSRKLSTKFQTQISIYYNPFITTPQDGRQYSFAILNNKNNKIGSVNLYKPSLDLSINSLLDTANKVQSILAALALLLIAFGFRNEFKSVKSRSIKLLLFTIYCVGFRIVLYYIGIPSNLISGPLTDPANFSSIFAGGVVKSPAEFLITNIFLLLILIQAYRYVIDFVKQVVFTKFKKVLFFSLTTIPVIVLFLLTIRGLSASVKSIIFDSTIRYFKEPNLIPNLPSIVMNLNTLLIGVSAVLFLCLTLIFLLSFFKQNKKSLNIVITAIFIVVQILGYIFILRQHEPLITPLINFIFISLVFLVTYKILVSDLSSVYNFVYITLIASLMTITLMNFFNLQLEKASLKTTALEINRSNDNLLRFLISETLETSVNKNVTYNAFINHNTNYEAIAFLLWSNSSLQRESLGSSVRLYDKEGKVLGGFGVGIDQSSDTTLKVNKYDKDKPKLIEKFEPGNSINRIITGFVPVKERGIIIGYLSASISFNLQNLGAQNIPDFLASKTNILNSVIDVKLLKIFEISDSKLEQVYGDIYPSRDQIKPIINAKFSPDNETWMNLSLNGINYITYVLKTHTNGKSRITSVSLQDKNISWELFNFFKIFIIHSIFIILLFITLLLFNFRKIKYRFRTQLLVAFLLISVLPLILLAIYNRQVVKQRSQTSIFNELSERSKYIERHISEEMKESKNNDYIKAFDNAGKDLGISFAVYEGANQIYNSKEQYYKAGLFTGKLDPEVYYEMNYLSYREYLTQEKIENFTYDSYYRKVNLEGRNLILGVNDAFNKVRLIFTVIDADVFLFGIYSFATIIIILLSTLLANRISSPIRKLTKATKAVAQGDLNVEIRNTERGELKDLFEGFNSMTKELRKNQIELAELERENAWKEMAKQVAHEIKNPLTPMKLAVQQLIATYKEKNKNFDKVFEKVSTTILNQVENLSLIASEFSRFARMPNFNLEEIDLIPILDDTVNLFGEENIKIQTKSEYNSAIVEADKSQLRRLFINLIRNSIQAEASRIDIETTLEDYYYCILVKDNGNGIPQKIQNKIFNSNFTTKESGMGLGLKLAKRFLEGIKGSIELVESSDAGTTFKISIPALETQNKNNTRS